MGPLAAVYGAGVAARSVLYDRGWFRSRCVPVPVISVGNLTAGGSGKSPMTGWIATRLRAEGLTTAVVSRGYGGTHTGAATVVSSGDGPIVGAGVGGDEPVMLAHRTRGVPIVVARRRIEGALLAMKRFGARCIVLDDGFQHRSLRRDIDLLLFDGVDPVGNGRLLPDGPLREPLAAAGRAHAAVMTRADRATPDQRRRLESLLAPHAPDIPLFISRGVPGGLVAPDGATAPAVSLAGRPVICTAGIARPDVFFDDVAALGARVVRRFPFPDHHRFSRSDLETLAAAATDCGAEWIVTTEKDLARFATPPSNLRALRLDMDIEDEETFIDYVLRGLV